MLAGCSHKPSQQRLLERIAKAEKQLSNDAAPVAEHALDAAEAYLDYVHAFPNDSVRNPEFWLKAAELHNVAEQPDTAIVLTDSLMAHYPEHDLIPRVLLFRGAVYDLSLGMIGRAEREYQRVVDEYNTPEYYREVTAALSALENLGKSGEQIYQELIEQGKIKE